MADKKNMRYRLSHGSFLKKALLIAALPIGLPAQDRVATFQTQVAYRARKALTILAVTE